MIRVIAVDGLDLSLWTFDWSDGDGLDHYPGDEPPDGPGHKNV